MVKSNQPNSETSLEILSCTYCLKAFSICCEHNSVLIGQVMFLLLNSSLPQQRFTLLILECSITMTDHNFSR